MLLTFALSYLALHLASAVLAYGWFLPSFTLDSAGQYQHIGSVSSIRPDLSPRSRAVRLSLIGGPLALVLALNERQDGWRLW